ncbi:uncharacterized protein LOC109798747 isoform X2 [Cajanus cajan]|uniref:Uncharacterized protein n=1 Tax=Cajanus cajan TaxID=3821 RepID=A0A151U8P7_CAJCA|nr:uncharacterized protein LOC109798747 isoform X2 [Cajanus cajan]KYP75667.1 hypothetical protein KK1_019860 [Cajanus cajan]
MEKDRRLELVDQAIQKLIHDNTNKVHESLHSHDTDTQYQNALAQLLSVSQLKVLKGDEIVEQYEDAEDETSVPSSSEPVASVIQKTEGENEDAEGSENDEIVKELKEVKRQNFITHCLLSVMIVLTVTWQLSEVSLILRVKDGLSHPFRSFGNMLRGMVKVPNVNGQEADDKENSTESSSLPSLGIPDMSHNGLTGNE